MSPPFSDADICTVTKAVRGIRRKRAKLKLFPPGCSLLRAYRLEIRLPATQQDDVFCGNAGRDQRFSYGKESRAAAARTLVHHQKLRRDFPQLFDPVTLLGCKAQDAIIGISFRSHGNSCRSLAV